MVNQFWAFVCETGFFGWVGSTIAFILRGFGPDNTFFARRAAFWGSLIVVFYALWVLGMMKA